MRLGVLEALDIDRSLRESYTIEINYISAASHLIIQDMLQREDQQHCYHGLSVYYANPLDVPSNACAICFHLLHHRVSRSSLVPELSD